MPAEERIRMDELCTRIQEEQDCEKFVALVQELNALLEKKEIHLIGNQRNTR